MTVHHINPLEIDRARPFLNACVFNLTLLDSVKETLKGHAKEACEGAIFIAAAAIDRVTADHPELEKEIQSMVDSFNEVPNG